MTLSPDMIAAIASTVAATMQQMGGPTTQAAYRQKAVSDTPNAMYIHGPDGLFSSCGLDRNVFSAMLLPQGGLGGMLPVYANNEVNPLYALLTGVGSATGDNPDGVCDDPKTSGFIYGCHQTLSYGRYSMQTPVFDIDRGAQRTRGERMDLRLIGGTNALQSALGMTLPGSAASNAVMSDLAANMFSFAIGWQREIYSQIYTGNPANNSAGLGYKEFQGLDLQINTGKVDALDNATLCPAVDSRVVAFNASITADTAATVQAFIDMYRHVEAKATLTGLNPVRWVWVMTRQLFYELTEFWPCTYQTYRCDGVFAAGDERTTDSYRLNQDRDAMRNGQYLLIEGKNIPVIIDDFIAEPYTVGPPAYLSSTAYLVPLTVNGGIPVLYWEHIDYNGDTMEIARALAPQNAYYTTDNGRFLWHKKPPTNFCVQAVVKTEPRLVLRTPHLAGRISGLQYSPSLILPNPTVGHPGYTAGGVQSI